MDKERLQQIQEGLKSDLKLNVTFGSDKAFTTERISTGMPMLDSIMGGGVIRRGAVIVHGIQSSGKSYIAYKTIASAQAEGLICALLDVEYSYDSTWGEKIGIDNDTLIAFQPDSAEQALDISLSLCESGVDLLVVDSIAALIPEAELDAGMTDWQMGLQARLINKFFRKIPPINDRAAVILINQHRVDINGRTFHGYTPYTLPGGKGQDFFGRIQIETKRGDFIYEKGEAKKKGSVPKGFTIRAKANKNKTHIPLLECEIPVHFTGDTDFYAEVFDVALLYGIIKQGGAYYSYREDKIRGKEAFLDELRSNEEMQEILERDVTRIINSQTFSEDEEYV